MSDKHININVPVLARVEGEGALDLSIENNVITNLKLRIYEPPRYFEKFLEGRSYKDVADVVARICGICPVAYQMSAIHAIESIYQHNASQWARDMRRLMYCGEWLQSHSLHIHMLAAPDFLGFNSIIEMAQEHAEEVRRGLSLQGLGNDLIRLLGGRSVHPVGVRAGGFFHAPAEEDVASLLQQFKNARQDAVDLIAWTASLDLAEDEQDFTSVSLRHPDEYPMNEGRLISDKGLDIGIDEFDEHFREQHMPQSTALHCLLHDEPYLVGPLARLNNNRDLLSDESKALLNATGITFPSRNMFHSIVARAVEIHFALNEAIRLMQAYKKPQQPFDEVQVQAGVGFACTEAPRGILWHRYELDSHGYVTSARIVPPTSQNQARIEQDIEKALNHYGLDHDDKELQLHAEKVIRNYDPCISCATHFLTLNVDRASIPAATYSGQQAGKVVTLIAIGSPVVQDNLAWTLVDRLQQDVTAGDINIIKLDRPGTNLLKYLRQDGQIYLLDAAITDVPTDNLLIMAADHFMQNKQEISSHDIGVASTLHLGKTLGQSLESVTVIGVPLQKNVNDISADAYIDRLLNELKICINVS